MAQRMGRLRKELQQLTHSPPAGITCWPEGDDLTLFTAVIMGEENTVYAGGMFRLEIEVPDRYPFLPPKVRFVTKVYHPNIDDAGRICLDVLKVAPAGSWRPIHNLASVLTSIRLLLGSPNPHDPLMTDIAEEYQFKNAQFESTAREWTEKYAKNPDLPSALHQEPSGKKRSLQPEDEEERKSEHSRGSAEEEKSNNKKQKQ